MSQTLDKIRSAVFVGQLFQGDPKSKSWTPLINGQVGMSLRQVGKGEWWMVAVKKEKVWEGKIEDGFKHRVRDGFVQWQQKGSGGSTETYGLRVKSDAIAQQMSEFIFLLLHEIEERKKEPEVEAPPPVQPPDVAAPDVVVLKVLLPGNDSTKVYVPKSATVQQILKSICQRRELDPTHFVASHPPNSPHGQPILCKGNMTVGELSINEIHLSKRRKSGKPESLSHLPMQENGGASAVSEQMLLQVELPKGERTVVRVSPSTSMADLLHYICDKRNMDATTCKFDLPATEESLAGRTLKELKINTIRVISKFPNSESDQSANSSPVRKKKTKERKTKERASTLESPKNKRRHAPPPPPAQRRRTQPEFMRELAAEMAGRKTVRKLKRINSQEESLDSMESFDKEILSHDTVDTPTGSVECLDSTSNETSPAKGEEPMSISDQSNRKMTATTSRGTLKPRSGPAPNPPTNSATPPEETKSHPPPVAEKPRKKKQKRETIGVDEPDSAPDKPVIPVIELEQPEQEGVVLKGQDVMGVKGKVKEQMERSELTESITDALKRQTATAERRYTGVAPQRKIGIGLAEGMTRHGSLEKEKVPRPKPRSQAVTPPIVRGVMVAIDISSEDDDVHVTGKSREPKLKPRGPAPPPPPAKKSHTLNRKANPRTSNDLTSSLPAGTRLKTEVNASKTAIKKSREGLDSLSDDKTSREEGSKVNSIRRKRPSRPAPVPPPVKPVETESQTQIVDFSHASPPPQPSPPSPPSQVTQHSTPSPKHTQSSPITPRRANAATAICQDTEDGGKVLIVQPSPSTDRKQKSHTLIFKLPPPPPQPNFGGKKEKASCAKTKEDNDTTAKNEEVTDKDVDDSKPHPLAHVPDASLPPHEDERQEDIPSHFDGNETVLSNEYTNLDDSSSDEELPATDPSPLNENTGTKQDVDVGTGTNGMGTGLNMSVGSSDGSTSGSEGGYDISIEGENPLDQHDTPSTNGVPFLPSKQVDAPIPPSDQVHAPIPPSDQVHAPIPPSDQVHAPIPPPVIDDEELSLNVSLNSNSNNSNESGEGFEPPELILPPPPDEFLDQSTNSSLDSSAEDQSITYTVAKQPITDSISKQPSQETDGGILLLSYKPVKKVEEPSVGPAASEQAKDGWTGKGEGSGESSKVIVASPSIGTQLQELDSIVSDLRELSNFEENLAMETGTAPPPVASATPIPPPPPPILHQIIATPPHTVTQSHTTQSSPAVISPNTIRKSPIPAKPKPPPVVAKEKSNTSPLVVRKIPPPTVTSETAHPPPPPVTTPLSPGAPVVTPLSSGAPEGNNIVSSGPSSKAKITNFASGTVTSTSSSTDSTLAPEANTTADSLGPSSKVKRASSLTRGGTDTSTSSNELLEKFKERRAKLNQQSSMETQPGHLPVQNDLPPNPISQPPFPVPAGGGDNVHMQLQFLQQQVLQQQMLQLQQQFQQLQSFSMHPGTGMGVPGMGMVPGQYVPQAHPIAPPALYPSQQVPPGMLGSQPPMPSLLGGGSIPPHMIPGQIHPGFIPQPGMPLYPSHPVGYTTPPHSGAIQVSPPASQPPSSAKGLEGVAANSPVVHRKNSEDFRTSALGNLEYKFDALMDEVRDTDPTVVLRKIPEAGDPTSPSYTGMAAVLAEALRQRRQHFADKRRSRDMDDSITSDWQSP